MKKLTFLILISLHASLFTLHSYSQPCLPEGITFIYQFQINAFQTNYPNCTEIEGGVIIDGFTPSSITNLNGLNVLTSIGADLSIHSNDALATLSGLENLTSIGGDLSIRTNFNALANLSGLENVTSIGGDFVVFRNLALINLIGLDNLTTIGGTLSISRNESLTSLSGLENLTTIGGELMISRNEALTTLTGIDNIEAGSITNLTINKNRLLSDCEVNSICGYLSAPGGIVTIYHNAPGCYSPVEIANECGITLPCLPYGNYYFTTQEQIDNFQTNYPICTQLEGDVEIGGDNISSLNGLNVLTSISGSLVIRNNDFLESLTGLENLTSIGGNLSIYRNNSLLNLMGLENLITIGGSLSFGWRFGMNTATNPLLTSLAGLNNLNSIGGDLSISYLSSLTSLTGLENLTSISGDLSIYENWELSTCDVQSICDYLAAPSGTIYIDSNAPGCNSQEEVEEACAQSVGEISVITNLSVHPNPFANVVTIEFELRQHAMVTITIYNHIGQQLELITESKSIGQQKIEWDCKDLTAGIYFCVLKTNYGIHTEKIIKL